MKSLRLFSTAFVLASTFAFAQDLTPEFEGKQENPDMDALNRWLKQKRMVTIKEIGGDLALSGEVRFEMQAINEKKNGISQRGPHGATDKPDYAFDIEVNLMLDYHADRTWACVKLEFDNDMGQVGGTTNKIALERAFFGGRLIDGETVTFDGEMGRRNLNNTFDSKIEFASLFDGILLKFSKATDVMGDFYINGGGFVINDRFHHFGFVSEVGMLNIGNTGMYTKYSFIDWKEHKYPQGSLWNRYNYQISQLTLGYQFTPARWKKIIKFYAAALLNHSAKQISISNFKRYNQGYYAGVSIGQISVKGDWALDMNYQYVMPQAIPDFDVSGIKRGNAAGVGFYTQNLNGTGPDMTDKALVVGSCNYKGFIAELLYALSNNLTWYNAIEFSNNQTFQVGPNLRFFQFETEFVYAF